jgi:predicted nucleic acid-binding protein
MATLYSPDVCFEDARYYVSQILEKRALNPESGLSVLAELSELVESVDLSLYADFERLARERIEVRDPDDWPVVAVALLLDLPT